MLDRIPNGAHAAVIRLRSLGDCVLSTPALELLHQARPDLKIGIVVERWLRPVFTGNPAVSEILEPVSLGRWKPYLCLNLHGGTRSAWLTATSGARVRAGFEHFRFPFVYSVRIPKAQGILRVNRTVHTAEHLASAIFYLGAPMREIPRASLFPCGAGFQPAAGIQPAWTASVKRSAGGLKAAAGSSLPHIVIHPFASAADKTWPADRFLALAQSLAGEFNVIFIGAASDDLSPFRSCQTAQGLDLENLKSLLAGASLFIGNDSGPAHMAAALGIPLVVLWGNSSREIWGPWQAEHVVLDDLDHVSVAEALDAIERLRVKA